MAVCRLSLRSDTIVFHIGTAPFPLRKGLQDPGRSGVVASKASKPLHHHAGATGDTLSIGEGQTETKSRPVSMKDNRETELVAGALTQPDAAVLEIIDHQIGTSSTYGAEVCQRRLKVTSRKLLDF